MPVAANFAGGVFKVTTDIPGDTDPKVNPALALMTTELFDPGSKLVKVYFVVTTEVNNELFKRMSYELAPRTGFQLNSEDVYPVLLAVRPVTGSLAIVNVLVGDQTFGVKLLRIRTLY
jgi:hypothetical protein